MSTSEPAAATTAAPPANPLKTPRQCRYLKTGGEQCRGRAVLGHHYCQSHKFNRRPTFTGVKGYDRVAFLEDHASIQLITSQILQGLLDRTVEPERARAAASLLTVSNTTLRDLRAHERWLLQNNLPLPEMVAATVRLDGDELAPEQEYRGPNNSFEPQWSFSKFRYEQLCERLGRPQPTSAQDFPASGWLTEAEIKEQETDASAMVQRYNTEIAELEKNRRALQAQETAAALAAGLPDPHLKRPRPCPHNIHWCGGPGDERNGKTQCERCLQTWDDERHGLAPAPEQNRVPEKSSSPNTQQNQAPHTCPERSRASDEVERVCPVVADACVTPGATDLQNAEPSTEITAPCTLHPVPSPDPCWCGGPDAPDACWPCRKPAWEAQQREAQQHEIENAEQSADQPSAQPAKETNRDQDTLDLKASAAADYSLFPVACCLLPVACL